jgi:hypothetical protein
VDNPVDNVWTAFPPLWITHFEPTLETINAMAAPYTDGPIAALRRIAFLLERSRAETYKVKAFRAAAATRSRSAFARAPCASCRVSGRRPPR